MNRAEAWENPFVPPRTLRLRAKADRGKGRVAGRLERVDKARPVSTGSTIPSNKCPILSGGSRPHDEQQAEKEVIGSSCRAHGVRFTRYSSLGSGSPAGRASANIFCVLVTVLTGLSVSPFHVLNGLTGLTVSATAIHVVGRRLTFEDVSEVPRALRVGRRVLSA